MCVEDPFSEIRSQLILLLILNEHEVRLFALPARFGGLGISDPVESAMLAFSSSRESASAGKCYSWCHRVQGDCSFGSADQGSS